MKAVHLTHYGEPVDAYQYVEIPEPPAPGPGEALIQVEYSPVNISDFLLARGTYPVKPVLPAVVGNEGAGHVLAVGRDVTTVKVGDKVLVPYANFAWAERVLAPAADLFVLPSAIDMQQAAMARINPTTAYLLLNEIVPLKSGNWIVQNAANSGVGRAVIAMARSRGIKTISLVRRPELVEDLERAGGDVVLVNSTDVPALVAKATDGAAVPVAFDGVGGPDTALLGAVLDRNSTIVSYATMSGGKPITINFSDVGKRIQLRGFFMYYPEFVPRHPEALREGVRLILDRVIHTPVAATYPLSHIREAAEHVQRGGKVLLDIGNS